jgi:glycogen operon protein
MIEFVGHLTCIRRGTPLLRRRRFFKGRPNSPDGFKDVYWFRPDGQEMTDSDWRSGSSTIGLRLAGDEIEEPDVGGETILAPSLMIIIHAGHEQVKFVLPTLDRSEIEHTWELILDTNTATGESDKHFEEQSDVVVPGRTVWLLQGSMTG